MTPQQKRKLRKAALKRLLWACASTVFIFGTMHLLFLLDPFIGFLSFFFTLPLSLAFGIRWLDRDPAEKFRVPGCYFTGTLYATPDGFVTKDPLAPGAMPLGANCVYRDHNGTPWYALAVSCNGNLSITKWRQAHGDWHEFVTARL